MTLRRAAHRIATAIAGAALAVAGALLPTAPAAAASEGIEFSLNGTVWTATPPAALFPSGLALVPGSTQTVDLWVRHTHASDADLRAVIRDITVSDPGLQAAVTIEARDDDGHGLGPEAIGSVDQCSAIVPMRDLGSGVPLHIRVSIELQPAVSGADLRNQTLGFTLAFGAADVGTPVPADGCPVDSSNVPSTNGGGGGGGTLSFTGTPPTLLPAGIVLLVMGLLVMLLARRRDDGDIEADLAAGPGVEPGADE